MNIKRHITLAYAFCAGLSLAAQPASKQATLEGRDYTESTSYNEAQRGTARRLQYYPEGEDFVCVNGKNRYTRALYGNHTAYRLETSDRPVFAIYNKPKSWNIAFRLTLGGHTLALDSTAYCQARYTPGKRTYTLADPVWGADSIRMVAIPLPDCEEAIWQINAPRGSRLQALIAPIRAKRLSRNGDMGADPADSFEASTTVAPVVTSIGFGKEEEAYILYRNGKLTKLSHSKGKALYQKAEAARKKLVAGFRIDTPDPYINTLGGALAAAADGIWDGKVWLHGACGWRMPLNGWRAAYTGDCLGWFDRARTHFDNYAASQVTDVPPVYSHPTQDSTMNLARAAKKWGTQMYSNGYICRNPNRNNQMHHYDMNLCYVDELLWHLCWTGDTDYARKMWPVLTAHLAWEKRNFDPDGDGLYDAYCCIWASDALYYNSGAVTHSSAYNYRANKLAALIAEKIGEDGSAYAHEAERIKQALKERLWMRDKGCWAEFQDFMGKRRLHTSPGIWTVYHAIDSDVSDLFQYYQATDYVSRHIPRIPITAAGLADDGYYTISTTNWMPYSWSINNVAFAEVWHMCLAYWQAGQTDEAFHLFKSSVLDGMYLGNSPGNFGQISFYDAARGECYRDFGDPVGVASRALVQGLFGITPDLLDGVVTIRPGFPQAWGHAGIHTSYIDFTFRREGNTDRFHIKPGFPRKDAAIRLVIPARKERVERITVNGQPVKYDLEESIGCPRIRIDCPTADELDIEVCWAGHGIDAHDARFLKEKLRGQEGDRMLFARMEQGDMSWWTPLVTEDAAPKRTEFGTTLPVYPHAEYVPVVMDSLWNASVTDIFQNSYDSPRSPYTTLQIPRQGIGEWCHPKETADIDDSGLRSLSRDGVFVIPQGVPFRTPAKGKNIAYTSLWDNYPDSLSLPLTGKAAGIYLMLAGSTNYMQCRIENGRITVTYADGSHTSLPLMNPENWAPIEQDFYFDGLAFRNDVPRPYRVALASGLVSNRLETDLKLKGFNDRRIPGGAATLLYLPLDGQKELRSLQLETMSNDVVIGLMGVTLVRP